MYVCVIGVFKWCGWKSESIHIEKSQQRGVLAKTLIYFAYCWYHLINNR